MSDVGRRDFITLLGGAVAPWPLAARAQQPAIPVVGFLNTATADAYSPMAAAFREGLKEAGYAEGRNVAIQYRWAENRLERLPALVGDLTRQPVALILAGGNTDAALTAKAATPTIPIVFVSGIDAVQIGLVASLNHPGGNVTGVTFLATSLGPKKLEILRALLPTAAVIGMLINTNLASANIQIEDVQTAGRTLGLQIHVLHASAERDLDAVFASLAAVRAGGLVVGADAFLNSQRDHLVAQAAHYSIPTVYPWREAVTAGGLMSYGASPAEAYRQAGLYAGKILNGDKPADLPVIQSTKIDLVINLKTAKTLGLTVPLPLLAFADEVIE
jgi:putative tryptophan/tyrosine transport system substrate-binding protein